MAPTFRPLARADQAFLWRALYDALHVPPGDPPFPRRIVERPEIARYVAAWMTRPDDAGVVVEVAGGPVGAAWLRRWTGADVGYGFVDPETPELSMAVAAAHRGRGLGTDLLRRVLDTARMRHPGVSLSVSPTNPARRLYERFGFEPVAASRTADASQTMRLRF